MGFDKCIVIYIHHYYIIQNSFIVLKVPGSPFTPLPPNPWQPVSYVLSFPEGHRVGIIEYVTFSDWLFSHSNVLLGSFMSFYGLIAHFFLSMNNILSRITACLSVHLLKNILFATKISIWLYFISFISLMRISIVLFVSSTLSIAC